jgi:hypothetical protein
MALKFSFRMLIVFMYHNNSLKLEPTGVDFLQSLLVGINRKHYLPSKLWVGTRLY